MWNVIYNGWSNKSHLATSPNTAPAMQNECHQWSASHMKRHFQYSEQVKSPFKLTKYCACQEIVSSRFQREIPEVLPPIDDSNRSDNNPTIKSSSRNRTWLVPSWHARCMKKYNISRSGYLPELHEMRRLPGKVTLQLHQILRLAQKMHSTLLYSILSWHLFSKHLFSLGIYSLLTSFLSWHLFSLGIYSLLASILSWHLFSLGIYSFFTSFLSWHLFSLDIFFSLGICSLLASILLASILSWHLFSLGIYSLSLFKTS